MLLLFDSEAVCSVQTQSAALWTGIKPKVASSEDNIRKTGELQRESSRVGFGFLMTDVDTALSFAQVALDATDDAEKRARNRVNARKAYEAVMRFRERVDAKEVADADIQELERRLQRLRIALEQLGEVPSSDAA